MQFNKHGHPLVAVFIVVLLSACTTPHQTRQLSLSPPDIPSVEELKTVPFYAQRDYQCGPAALATVINHYGIQTSIQELIPLVYVPELKGSLQVEMLAVTNRFGRLSMRLDGKLESILTEVSAGHPVLVMQNLGLDSYPFWHYAVVIGYDLQAKQIILRSGEIERLVRPFSVFERTWQRADFWSLVVVPPEVIPETVSEDEFMRAVIAFEAVGMKPSVYTAYQTGVKRWPLNFILQMGLGNTSYALKRYQLAEQAFRAAIAIEPGRAEAWNNLAFSLLGQQKKRLALEAVNEALKLQPGNEEYLSSRNEIRAYQ